MVFLSDFLGGTVLSSDIREERQSILQYSVNLLAALERELTGTCRPP